MVGFIDKSNFIVTLYYEELQFKHFKTDTFNALN